MEAIISQGELGEVCDQLTAGLVMNRAVVIRKPGKGTRRLATVWMCEGQEATTGATHFVFGTGSPLSWKLS